MDEQQIQDAINYWVRPWSERRGIETIDRNAEVILIRTPLNNLSNVLATQAIETRQDVIDSEIEILGNFVFTYQIVGQPWSIMIPGYVPEYGSPQVADSNQLTQLSRHLNQPIIRLLVSDTGSWIGYELFEDGKLIEYFRGTEGYATDDSNTYEIQPQRCVWYPSLKEIEEDGYSSDEIKQIVFFWSSRHQIAQEQMSNIWGFASQLLLDYDAFDPALDNRYLLGTSRFRQGDRYRVQNAGVTCVFPPNHEGHMREVISVLDLVRVDYFRF